MIRDGYPTANKAVEKATIRDLRAVLETHFDGIETVFRRLREGGSLPNGKPGRDGVGSAEITPQHAATTLLAVAASAWSAAAEAPHEAARLAGFVMRYPRDDDPPALLHVLAGELRRAVDPDYRPGEWRIGEYSVRRTVHTGRVAHVGDDVVPSPDLWRFEPPGDRLVMPADEQGRPMAMLLNRNTEISSGLISALGRLFAVSTVEAAD